MRISASVDFWIASASASGTLTFRVEIDFYDPYPETSGGLVRYFCRNNNF